MDVSTKAKLVEEGGKLVGDMIRLAFSRPSKRKDPASTDYPPQTEALKKLGPHTVVTLHDDGAATVRSQGKLFIVTTGGNIFEQTEPTQPAAARPAAASGLPTSDETTLELKRRLSKELYRAELDLVAGLMIAGKSCDCLSEKHTLGLEAAAEELISQDPGNPVYQEIIDWIPRNRHKVSVEAIRSGKYASEYPHMANEFKVFRKRILGSVGTEEPTGDNLTLEQAQRMAAEEAAKEVERAWNMEG